MAETPIRHIRVPDEVWEKARLIAAFHDTTVSAMVVEFLRKVNYRGQIKMTARNVSTDLLGKLPPPVRTGTPSALVGPKLKNSPKEKIDPLVCDHPVLKTIPYGTFCTACGTKMPDEDAI